MTPLRWQPVLFLLATIILAASVAPARGQGMLIDSRPGQQFRLPRPIVPPQPAPPASSYRIESLEVDAKLNDSVARVQVSQTFKNTASGQIEASFVFPLPYDGAIDQLTLLVDGKEFPAKLLTKEEARQRYEEIVRTNRDPALLEWVGAGMFQTSVFPIPAGATRTVTLRYTQLCRRSAGLTDFLFPLSTAKYTDGLLKKLKLNVTIDSPIDLKNIYSPTHEVKIERSGKRQALVKFSAEETVPTDDFRLFFDAGDQPVAASVVSYRPEKDEPGYFLLLATPEIQSTNEEGDDGANEEKANTGKTVIFVVDRSGSMSGEKMDQAKEALKFVLNNLKQGDTFNIVAYDSEVEAFRPELQKFDDDSRNAAVGFVNGLFAGGSTNIDGALDRGLGMLENADRPSYVIFLTDGLPTVGEMNEAAIAKHAAAANKIRARMFAFGVGYDVNSRLLDRLARDNFGRSEYVRPNENIETAVSSLYRRIGAPVMTDVELTINVDDANAAADGDAINRLYPKGMFDLFAGDQAVIVGRYNVPGDAKATLAGKLAGEQKKFNFPTELTAASDDDANAFVAKLWATRRVGDIIDEIDLKGRNEELVNELVELATKHGILTPYTSFLADDNNQVRELSLLRDSAAESLTQLDAAEGQQAFNSRANKSSFQYAARPAAAPAAATGPALAEADASGGYGGRFGVDSFHSVLETRGRGVVYYDSLQDRQIVAKSMINVGRKTFNRRGDRWVDATLSEEKEKSAKQIERFSDEYFDLVAKHGKHVAPYLAIDEPVTIELDGQVYQW